MSKFVAQSRPGLDYSGNNKLNTQSENLETAKLRVFVRNISSLPSVKAAMYEIRVFVSRISPPLEHQSNLLLLL